MNFAFSKLTLPLVAAIALGAGCRQTEQLSPAPMPAAAGMGAAGMAAAPVGSAVATLTSFMGGTVTGTATFVKATGTDVTVTVTLANCVAGKSYPVHIHQGTSCADIMAQGDHWGPARGEGIPNVTCTGTTGTSMLTRPAIPTDTAWTIGGDATTNVVGHAFVLHMPDATMTPPPRIACGVIMQK